MQTMPTLVKMLQNAASEQGLHCLLTRISMQNTINCKRSPEPLKLEIDSYK